jgi:hypothetical protein
MKPMLYVGVMCGVVAIIFLALTTEVLCVPEAKPCTQAWFQYLDDHYVETIRDNSDVDGGPNLGAGEWLDMFVVITKITVPDKLSEQQRCQFVQQALQERIYIVNKVFSGAIVLKVR